jgi:hypothetical protein
MPALVRPDVAQGSPFSPAAFQAFQDAFVLSPWSGGDPYEKGPEGAEKKSKSRRVTIRTLRYTTLQPGFGQFPKIVKCY